MNLPRIASFLFYKLEWYHGRDFSLKSEQLQIEGLQAKSPEKEY